jgi:hypothetical protein
MTKLSSSVTGLIVSRASPDDHALLTADRKQKETTGQGLRPDLMTAHVPPGSPLPAGEHSVSPGCET